MSTPASVQTAIEIKFLQTVPILRIFDLAKAREFYCDFLGFKVDWEHRFKPGLPMYMQVSARCVAASPQRAPWRRFPWSPRVCRNDGD